VKQIVSDFVLFCFILFCFVVLLFYLLLFVLFCFVCTFVGHSTLKLKKCFIFVDNVNILH